MTGINVGSILAGLTSDKACDAFVGIGLVDADGVCVPVGGAEVWGACGSATILAIAVSSKRLVCIIKMRNKFCVD